MLRGDLVKCWILEEYDEYYHGYGPFEDPYAPTVQRNIPRIGIVLDYERFEKIATVSMQDTGEIVRVRARDIEIIKRSPENAKYLKELAEENKN